MVGTQAQTVDAPQCPPLDRFDEAGDVILIGRGRLAVAPTLDLLRAYSEYGVLSVEVFVV